jgi:hypothetical protein
VCGVQQYLLISKMGEEKYESVFPEFFHLLLTKFIYEQFF